MNMKYLLLTWNYSVFVDNIDSRIYDIDQYAIFSKKSFADLRMNKIFDEIHFSMFSDMVYKEEEQELDSSEYDELESENEEYDYDFYSGDLAFNILYLKKLRLYMEKYGVNNELLETYNRLLYATDSPELCLFIDKCMTSEFKNLEISEIDDSDLMFIKEEVRFMAYEIFAKEPNNYTIRKLLFISTYYELTKDEKILKNINKHNNNKNFDNYTKIIFGEKDYIKTLKK